MQLTGRRFALAALFFMVFSAGATPVDTMTICNTRNVTLTIYTITGNAVAWQWSLPGATYSGPTNDSTVKGVGYPTPGVYTATCKVTFSTGKDSNHVFIINSFDPKVKNIPLFDTVICGNVSLTLDAGNANSPIMRFKWLPGNQTTRTISVNTAGTYSVSVYSVDEYSYDKIRCPSCMACDSQVKQAVITTGAPALVNLGPDRFICNDNPITLDAGPGMTSYLWYPNNETTRTITVNIGGTYGVTIVNSDKCTGNDIVTFKDSCPMLVFVPDAFTPDDNGLNEVFIWKGNMKMKTFTFKVYNRWGQKMFETDDPTKGWDGKYNNANVSDGVYCYLLDCVDANEVRHTMRGSITLMR